MTARESGRVLASWVRRIERLEQEYYVIVQARIEELEQRIRG